MALKRAVTSGNQVLSESEFTAIDSVCTGTSRPGTPPSPPEPVPSPEPEPAPEAPVSPKSARALSSSHANCRANRTTATPDSVGRSGLDRTSSTRPVRCSSALIRWLTADGVTCRIRAAASNVPASTATRSVRTWSSGRSVSKGPAPSS